MRGLPFGVGLTLLVSAVGCGAREQTAPTDAGVQREGVAIASSSAATMRTSALRARFALGEPEIERFEVSGGRARAIAAARKVLRRASVELPLHADGEASVEDESSHVAVRFSLVHARPAKLENGGGLALYRGAYAGFDVLHRVHAEGTEDLVAFDVKPQREELVYRVDVTKAAGVRLVSNTFELLDASGTPRLRIAPPWVIDANGARHEATLAVEGCSYDVDPRAPWDRPITKPGSTHCKVTVQWRVEAYPALVDPSWTTTGSMATLRAQHTATLLPSGKVLIAGGRTTNSDTTSNSFTRNAELFDGTGAFAATGYLGTGRARHTATLLPSGKVLIAGGEFYCGTCGTAMTRDIASAELFDGAATFAFTGSLAIARVGHTATLLPSGKVLIVGSKSIDKRAELFDGTSVFTPTGSTIGYRSDHLAVLLSSGKVLIASGAPALSTAELFDGVGTFASTGALTKGHPQGSAVAIDGGRVLIAGGTSSTTETTAEIFDGTSSFAATGSMGFGRRNFGMVRLGSGRVLVVGGPGERTAEYWSNGAFTAIASMAQQRYSHTTTLLPSGKVLVTGGYGGTGNPWSSAELLGEPGLPGDACTADAHCTGGNCNDGICCSATCTGTCKTCVAGTGACLTVTNAIDADTCSGVNICSASGACKLKNGQPSTDPTACASGFAADSLCCDTACNGACNVCNAAGSIGTCKIVSGTAGSPVCSPYMCGTTTACPTTCASDGGCVSTSFCSATKCVAKKANGAACPTGAHECSSGSCVDGVCCNLACNGQCEACDVSGSVGTCLAVAGAPHGTRTKCSGSGGCEAKCDGVTRTECGGFPTSATQCAAATCTSGSYTPPRTCNGAGVCSPTTSTNCGSYTCSGTVCRTSCTVATQATDCAAGYNCSGGVCITNGTLGTVCTSPTQCTSGSCVDGVCCSVASCSGGLKCNANTLGTCSKPLAGTCADGSECGSGACVDGVCCTSACSGQCEACDVPGVVGTCSAVAGAAHGTRTSCAGSGTCQATCDGANRLSCAALPGSSTPCDSASCSGGTAKSIAYCDGAGTCGAPPSKSCAPYVCEGSSVCKTTCVAIADCTAGYACREGLCVPAGGLGTTCTDDAQCASDHCVANPDKSVCCSTASCASGSICADTSAGARAGLCQKSNGQACADGTECTSGTCADGVCCDRACAGQCEACDIPGSIGKCEGVAGDPHGARAKCSDGGGDICRALGCDGAKDRTKCSVFARGLETECAPSACKAGTETTASTCDGSGACTPGKPRPCSPFACGEDKCKVTCAADADCSAAYTCNKESGTCEPIKGVCSEDQRSTVPLDKTLPARSCAPYRCNTTTGDCYGACTTSAECGDGATCDVGKCVPSAAPPSDEADGGCGYANGRSQGAGFALVALALAASRRRRAGRAS